MLVQSKLPIFSNLIHNKSTSVFSNQQISVTNSQIDKLIGQEYQDISDAKKESITSYVGNASTIVTATLGRNSFGTIIDLEAITKEKVAEFKQADIRRKVEAVYSI